MKKWIVFCLGLVFFCSCGDDKANDSYTLQLTDAFLRYELDSDVKMPLTVRTCMGDNDCLYFQNSSWPELLIYDIWQGTFPSCHCSPACQLPPQGSNRNKPHPVSD